MCVCVCILLLCNRLPIFDIPCKDLAASSVKCMEWHQLCAIYFLGGKKILFIDKQRWNVEAGEINGWTCILTFLPCMQLKKGDF